MTIKKCNDGSISRLIVKLETGDDDAAFSIWEKYFGRILEIARHRLPISDPGRGDEEDIAVCVFKSLCRGAVVGNFSELQNRTDLWKLLLKITHQKVVAAIRYSTRLKRGGVLTTEKIDELQVASVPATDPSPELLNVLDETFHDLPRRLRDNTMRQIVMARLEGRSNEQVADEFQISVRSVQPKLRLVEQQWVKELLA